MAATKTKSPRFCAGRLVNEFNGRFLYAGGGDGAAYNCRTMNDSGIVLQQTVAREAGFAAVLEKPLRDGVLVQTIGEVISAGRRAGSDHC